MLQQRLQRAARPTQKQTVTQRMQKLIALPAHVPIAEQQQVVLTEQQQAALLLAVQPVAEPPLADGATAVLPTAAVQLVRAERQLAVPLTVVVPPTAAPEEAMAVDKHDSKHLAC